MTPGATTLSENLREAMRFFGSARAEGEVRRLSSLTLISSGIDYSVFNAAVLDSAVCGSSIEGLRMELKEAEQFYEQRRLPWSFWACEDLIEDGIRNKVRDMLTAMDMRHLTTAPGMYAERLLAPSRTLPEVTIRPVSDNETRASFAHITSMAFEIPLSVCRAVYADERAWKGAYAGWIAYSGRVPVATVALVVCGGAIGTVLQSTSMGLPLYRALGYQPVTRFQVFASRR